ncbi:MAG: hypothetical protein WCG27_04970 [Pseudomonadota bacterium]
MNKIIAVVISSLFSIILFAQEIPFKGTADMIEKLKANPQAVWQMMISKLAISASAIRHEGDIMLRVRAETIRQGRYNGWRPITHSQYIGKTIGPLRLEKNSEKLELAKNTSIIVQIPATEMVTLLQSHHLNFAANDDLHFPLEIIVRYDFIFFDKLTILQKDTKISIQQIPTAGN